MAGERIMKGHILDFAIQMKKLVNNKEHSDIKFLIGPNRKPIYAHRAILSARCAIFKAMFADQAQRGSSGDKDVPCVLSDMSPDVFLAMLEFLYTNCVTLTPKIGIDILATSIEYGLDELRRLASEYLVENLSVQNATECLQAAVTYGQDVLRNDTIVFIDEHTENVFKSKGFQELSEDALVELLGSDGLQLDELDILNYVKEWATVNAVVLNKSVSEVARRVIPRIRLALLASSEIEELEKDNKKDHLIPVECFNNSWKFHAMKKAEADNPLQKKRAGTMNREHHSYLAH
ncbi:BTB/POZ domain-containing protein 19-like [Ylistrum balloti]|uniref:BTB/POZ domain-containing protein 19-like n=1 Tax=Ylistrum balloti TaxID=509963 RepID=UPI002905CAA5|nr:BTB/POZ domain-containing protein 19-like [Ylistrum balloti]